jgi:ornithine carbamoyltransferase
MTRPTPRHFLSLLDLSSAEVSGLLDLAVSLKARRARGVPEYVLAGRTLAMVFEKPSLRTRVSFEVGMIQLGGRAIHLTKDEVGLGQRESVKDAARVLSGMVDAIMIRTFAEQKVRELAEHSTVPVINGLSDADHPCQALADLLTLKERWGGFAGRRLVYVGDGNNVANALASACAKVGPAFAAATPAQYRPCPDYLARVRAGSPGAVIELYTDPFEAVRGADAIYTDTWVSMGQEAQAAEKPAALAGYQVNAKLVAAAKPDAVVMHCLPAHRGQEITDEVIDGPRSVVIAQAENRLHAQKAVLATLMAGRG